MKRFMILLLLACGLAFCFTLGTQGQEGLDTERINSDKYDGERSKIKEYDAQQNDIPQIDTEENYTEKTDAETYGCYPLGNDCLREEAEQERAEQKRAEQERAVCLKELYSADNRMECFLDYKDLIAKQEGILEPPASIYDRFPEVSLERLFRVVQAEIGDEYSFEQKCNVASVIFNRVSHPEFGNSLEDVLTPGQFATISNGRYLKAEVSEETVLACEYSFLIGDTTDGCLFFDSNGSLRYSFVFNDGAHNFYRIQND